MARSRMRQLLTSLGGGTPSVSCALKESFPFAIVRKAVIGCEVRKFAGDSDLVVR